MFALNEKYNNRRAQMIDVGGNITTYTWTDDNQLAAITLPNSGGTVTNTYDGDGLRFTEHLILCTAA